jgi:hypothetical protein
MTGEQSQGGVSVGKLTSQSRDEDGLTDGISIVCNKYHEEIKNIGKGVPNGVPTCYVSDTRTPSDFLAFYAPFSRGGGCGIEEAGPWDFEVWAYTPGTCTPTVYDRTTRKTVRGRKIRFT